MRNITQVVLHHTAVEGKSQAEGVERNHRERFKGQNPEGIAYHYLYENDGTEIIGRPEGSIGWHAGVWKVNKRSIGMCLAGRFSEDTSATEDQLESISSRLVDVCVRHRIRWDNVKLHRDIKSTSCPGIDLKLLISSSGYLQKEEERKLDRLKRALRITSRVRMLRYWILKRKIAFLETQFN